MATARGALPLGFDPLGSNDDTQQAGPLAQLLSQVGRNTQDENLAIGAGMGMTGKNWTPGGALTSAMKADSDYRLERDKLMSQYVPLIQQAMQQQYEMQMLPAIMGMGAPSMGGAPSQGSASAPGASGATGAFGGAGPQQGSAPGAIGAPSGGMSLDQAWMADAVTGGKYGLVNKWKLENEGITRNPNTFVQIGNKTIYIPDVKSGIGYDMASGAQVLLPGAAANTRALAGATADAQEEAKARTELVDVTVKDPNDPTGKGTMQIKVPKATLLGLQQSQAQPPAAAPGKSTNETTAIRQGVGDVMKWWNNPDAVMSELGATQDAIANGALKGDQLAQAKDYAGKLQQQFTALKGGQSTPPPGDASLPAGVIQAAPSSSQAAAAAGQKTAAEKAAESAQNYKNALDDKVEGEFQLVQRNKQIMPLLERYNTGGIAPEERLSIGNAIANSGMLQSVLGAKNAKAIGDRLAGGDVTAGKDLENQLASAGILTMLQTLDKEAKPNQAIFKKVAQAQEGLKSGNASLKDIFELQNQIYQIHYNEQQAMAQAIRSNTYDPRTWTADYAKIRNDDLSKPPAPLPSAPKFQGFSAVLKKG